MKTTKRIFAVIMAAAIMILCCFSVAANGATLTVTGDQLPGKYVDAYRMFTANWLDVNTNGIMGPADTISYELESAWEGFFTDEFLGSTSGATRSEKAYNYLKNMQNDSETLIDFADAAALYARNHQTELASLKSRQTAGAEETSVVIDNLTPGYYLVLPEGGSTSVTRHTDAMIVNVPSEKGNSLNLKSIYPTVVKTVDGGKKETSAQIGDTVTFTLTSAVPEMSDYTTYQFNFVDTMTSGLDYVADTVAVTIGGQNAKASDYTVSYENRVLTVAFSDLKSAKKVDGESVESAVVAGDPINVTYNATINANAVIDGAGNLNEAVVEYSNNPLTNGTGTSLPSDSIVYTYPIEIHKYHDSDTAANRLSGATFVLRNVNDENAPAIPLVAVDADAKHYRLAVTGDTETVTEVTTASTGIITIDGLKIGTYYLFETAAPVGYNKLAAPVTVTISTNTAGTAIEYSTPKYTVGSGTPSTSDIVPVENRGGSVLPSTGGIGTIGLTVAGVAVVILGILFTSRKKKSAKAQ
jgi:fimbrial isopeptide formation D2 family protein/LPXTG-motif cell wall-anchored protein